MALLRHRLSELTSRQCNEYQVQGGDIMRVPVGSVGTWCRGGEKTLACFDLPRGASEVQAS